MSASSPESKTSDTLPASRTEPSYLSLTEDRIKDALIEARGDVFIAAELLKVTALRVNRAIQASPVLSAALEESRKSRRHAGLTYEEISAAIEQRVSLYRVAGLDALHELATMPIDENSAQNQVKLAAAARLAGSSEGSGGGDDLAQTLRELNKSYQENAPRLRLVRERVTVETIPENVVESDTSQP